MCLLTFMREGVTANIEDLTNGALYNDDGFGFAVHAGSSIITGHGMVFDQVLEQFLKVRSKHQGVAMFHSRITTHGKTDVSNCHPFRVGGDNLTVVGHNGMLPIKIDKTEHRSDTRIFAENYLPSLGGVYALDDKDTFDSLEKWSKGSKLVIMTANQWANQDWYILNERDGHWEDGVWWSNYSYAYRPTRSYGTYGSSYSHGGSGWSGYVAKTPTQTPEIIDEEEAGYWNLYEITCPVCGSCEVYDLDSEDADICYTCGHCMWCEQYAPKDTCNCWGSDKQTPGPEYRKLTAKEITDWIYACDVLEEQNDEPQLTWYGGGV